MALATTFPSACSTSTGSTRDQGKVGRQRDDQMLRRAPAAGGAGHPPGHLAEIHPVPEKLEPARVDPGYGQQVAHHFIQVLGFMLHLLEKLGAGLFVELVAAVEHSGHRAENGGQRRAEIVGYGRQQGVAHPLGFRLRLGVDHVARQSGALEGRRRLFGEGVEQSPRFGLQGRQVLVGRHADNSDPAARRPERQKEPRRQRQGLGARARGLLMAEGPAGGRHARGVDLVLRRPGGPQLQFALVVEQHQ